MAGAVGPRGVAIDRSPRLGRLESRWTVVDGRSMHARVSIDPVPAGRPHVILIHGLAVSSRYLIPTAVRLAPDYPVYAPDLPGFGKSANPDHVLNLAELADVLAAWMDAVGLDRAALIGNSLGCQIIANFALRHPTRIVRAVMIGPTIDPTGPGVLEHARRLAIDLTREPPSAWFVQGYDYLLFGPRRLLRTFRAAVEDHVEAKLAGVQVPTLVVRGGRDPIVPQLWAETVAGLLPMGRLVVVPGAAHIVNFNAPDQLVRIVRPFLDEQD